MKTNIKLDKEEAALLESIEKDKWKTVNNIDEEIALAKRVVTKSLKK